jgi:hypothetical protein
MKKSMATIIDSGQIACIEGQLCVKNLCMLRGLIALAKTNRNVKCALFSLDLERAFDRVNHHIPVESFGDIWLPIRFYQYH